MLTRLKQACDLIRLELSKDHSGMCVDLIKRRARTDEHVLIRKLLSRIYVAAPWTKVVVGKLEKMTTIERYLGSKIHVSYSLEKDGERERSSWMITRCHQAFVTVWLHWSGNYMIWYWQCYRWLDLKGDTDYDFILNIFNSVDLVETYWGGV